MAPIATADLQSNTRVNTKPKAYLIDSYHPEAVARAQQLFDLVLPDSPECKNWKQAEYLLVRGSRLTADDISACRNLRAIGKQGVGVDKIDASACAASGIKILNTPGVNARAVAELVLTLTMALARQVRSIAVRQELGHAVPKEECSGILLHKCTIGIVGMGNIGKIIAEIFRGSFDSNIIAYDPYMGTHAWPDIPHKRVQNVEDLFQESDVITLHVPFTSETQDLISYKQMQLMKRSAILINTARGGIVNEDDLCRALDDRLIWGVGLDCHVQEPPTKEKYSSLWAHPNVLSLPHVGAATATTQRDTAVAAVERLYAYATRER
ncbi:hypothetical protein LTR05_006316 [Lithohypha guttulata]|uniref:D-3-phosphoglycerate dehydrogenase n=1 Tax=Lithohypha guttulata TaxID=1690604 RepID=A0AAN7SY65_9EURO|nr:hypothetical protein LTR05_006316 [Lithohypha guttulata]